MSNVLDLQALYGVMHNHLGGLYEGRVYPDIAKVRPNVPYIVYHYQSGGETDRRRRENSTITLIVKCISVHLEETFAGAMLIGDLLRDQGDQEGNTLPTDSEWRITTCSQGQLFHIVEQDKDSTLYYHTGHFYTFTMERRS